MSLCMGEDVNEPPRVWHSLWWSAMPTLPSTIPQSQAPYRQSDLTSRSFGHRLPDGDPAPCANPFLGKKGNDGVGVLRVETFHRVGDRIHTARR